jgi:hypothetical protein
MSAARRFNSSISISAARFQFLYVLVLKPAAAIGSSPRGMALPGHALDAPPIRRFKALSAQFRHEKAGRDP